MDELRSGNFYSSDAILTYRDLEFAREHPRSRVIGQDISMIQPSENCPPNLTFVREDTEEPWVFDTKFDYIHWRLMLTCCKQSRPPPPS